MKNKDKVKKVGLRSTTMDGVCFYGKNKKYKWVLNKKEKKQIALVKERKQQEKDIERRRQLLVPIYTTKRQIERVKILGI